MARKQIFLQCVTDGLLRRCFLFCVIIFTPLFILLRSLGHYFHFKDLVYFGANVSPGDEGFPYREDWNQGGIPEYCSRLIKDPKPRNSSCNFDSNIMACENSAIEPVMFSQFLQDFYLYSKHFKGLGRSGVYIDIAANDPISISNTYFFDRCLGWSGTCVDGNMDYMEPLFRERSCTIVPTCVGSRDGEIVDFNRAEGFGGIVGDTYKAMNRLTSRNIKDKSISSKISRLRCTTMEKVLKRARHKTIDYLSLDVEGHELEVLKGFNFSEVTINVMTIEGNWKSLKEIENFLSTRGYYKHIISEHDKQQHHNLLLEDTVFLHNSVKFGYP